MWIFLPFGFFSVVKDNDPSGRLAIRARVRADLDELRDRYLPKLSATIQTPHRDYQYRAYATHTAFATAIGRVIRDLDYSNYKEEVERVQGSARHALYSRIWEVMYHADMRTRRSGGRSSRRR